MPMLVRKGYRTLDKQVNIINRTGDDSWSFFLKNEDPPLGRNHMYSVGKLSLIWYRRTVPQRRVVILPSVSDLVMYACSKMLQCRLSDTILEQTRELLILLVGRITDTSTIASLHQVSQKSVAIIHSRSSVLSYFFSSLVGF